MLYTEGVFSKVAFDEIESSGGSFTDSLLRALSNTVSENHTQLRVFASVLLKSKETVQLGKDILTEWGKSNVNFSNVYHFFIYRTNGSSACSKQ